MKRLHQFLLIASFIPFCWLTFMAVHELGHILAGILSGGTITHVVIHPLAISRTDVSPNPHPLLVAWAGPIIGIALPLGIWGIVGMLNIPGGYLARCFAGFCLIANGAYVAVGSLERIGDPGIMLRHGSPIWLLWLFGVLTVPLGFLIWHRLGPKFGLGESRGSVDRWATYLSCTMFILLFLTTLLISPRF